MSAPRSLVKGDDQVQVAVAVKVAVSVKVNVAVQVNVNVLWRGCGIQIRTQSIAQPIATTAAQLRKVFS